MKQKLLLQKWWLFLLEGLLLIILSFLLFTRPESVIAGTAKIAGFVAIGIGLIALIGYFFGKKLERSKVELISGCFSGVAGIFFLSGNYLTSEFIGWFFIGFMLLNAATVAWINWELKPEINWWWAALVLFLLTLLLVVYFLSGKTTLKLPSYTLFGIQFLITGLIIILNSFVVKRIQYEFSQTISELRQKR